MHFPTVQFKLQCQLMISNNLVAWQVWVYDMTILGRVDWDIEILLL